MITDFLARLKQGLKKTSDTFNAGLASLSHRKLDEATLEALEELLITADFGSATAAEITAALGRDRLGKEIADREIRELLARKIAAMLAPVAKPLLPEAGKNPYVICVVGVNGNGKTTTLGKLAHYFKSRGSRVMLAAADTFRAAAVEQLKIWGERVGCEVITGASQADPASVAYQALEAAKKAHTDVLLIDTAGRLHTKDNLMAELEKLLRVLQKIDPSAPHAVVQVIDATTGQNALAQVEAFRARVKVTGLVLTKLDGTAKGGILVALAQKFGLPVHAIGIGEGMDDLQPFEPEPLASRMVGLE